MYVSIMHIRMSLTVSYRQPARGHEIVSVPIPMASSCFILFCLSHFESSIQAAYASYSKTYITAATPQLDWERLSPEEIHDLSSLQGEVLVYIGNPQASPITKIMGWVASVQNLLMFQHKTSVQKSMVQHIILLHRHLAHIQ